MAAVGAAFLLTGISGCKTADQKDDPLFGVKPQVNPVPPTTGAQSRATVPPIPGSTSGGSTAALAGLSNGRTLSINNPSPAGPQLGASAPMVQPIPRDVPRTQGLLTTGGAGQQLPAITPNLPPAPTTPIGDPSFAPLQARGAINQFVENTPDGVHLKVLVPNRADPGSVRVYEATARDTAAAVQAVVQQIDQQKTQ